MKKRQVLAGILSILTAASMAAGCGSTTSSAGSSSTAGGSSSASVSSASESSATDTSASAESSSAASSTSEGSAAWDTSKKDTVVVSVINNFYTAGEKKLAEDYMKLHPETKVVIDVVADNDTYSAKMATAFEGDRSNAPDIVHGNFVSFSTGVSMGGLVDKGYLYDMTGMLDEDNPYNDGKVRDAFDDQDLALALSEGGGKYITWLPFDKIGFALIYNKDIFDKEGVKVPDSYETLIEACKEFKDKGYDEPIATGMESFRLAVSIADAYYRQQEGDFLIQPGDALWDENTMSANKDFKWDESNPTCDQFTVFSNERIAKFAKDNGVNTPVNKQVFDEFYKAAQYFPQNWYGADSTQAIKDFETQQAPMLYQASFNAGLILSDVNELPDDQKFNWATSQIAKFDNPPEGFGTALRGYWDFGNIMSIIQKDDDDHMARVKDFYKYWYSADGAKTCYEETLSNGNFVQGPCIIKGVTLDKELSDILDGFATYPAKEFAFTIGIGNWNSTADAPVLKDLIDKFSTGELTTDEFLEQLSTVYNNYIDETIKKNGYDLDPATEDTPES